MRAARRVAVLVGGADRVARRDADRTRGVAHERVVAGREARHRDVDRGRTRVDDHRNVRRRGARVGRRLRDADPAVQHRERAVLARRADRVALRDADAPVSLVADETLPAARHARRRNVDRGRTRIDDHRDVDRGRTRVDDHRNVRRRGARVGRRGEHRDAGPGARPRIGEALLAGPAERVAARDAHAGRVADEPVPADREAGGRLDIGRRQVAGVGVRRAQVAGRGDGRVLGGGGGSDVRAAAREGGGSHDQPTVRAHGATSLAGVAKLRRIRPILTFVPRNVIQGPIVSAPFLDLHLWLSILDLR